LALFSTLELYLALFFVLKRSSSVTFLSQSQMEGGIAIYGAAEP
jgi:hypothetical protein